MTTGKYKFWMTQGQGCGEFPDAVFDTLEDALNEARSAFGEGSVGIQLPDGSWHKFDESWNMPVSVNMLRMKKGDLNPKQKWLMKKWREVDTKPKFLIGWLQTGGHTFQDIWHSMTPHRMEEHQAQELLFSSLTWGLFDIFEYPTGSMPTDAEIDWIVGGRKGQ